MPGLVVATFVVAPALAGHQSHDATPWTETVVAASTLLAGCAMLLAAGGFAAPRRGIASAGVGRA